jgi:hypothetical protein
VIDIDGSEDIKTEDQFDEIEFLYKVSLNCLRKVFETEYPNSEEFKQMVLVMNQNMIEYRFFSQAGLIK